MTTDIKYQTKVHFRCGNSRRRHLDAGPKPETPVETGRIPRVSRLMALAIRFDKLIRDGVVADQAELAHLGHVTRARLTQIMNLLNLAPDIQEEILHFSPVERGRDPVTERDLRRFAALADWRKQREMWVKVGR